MSSERDATLPVAWSALLDDARPDGAVRETIAASWQRSHEHGVEAQGAAPACVSPERLAGHQARAGALLTLAEAHITRAAEQQGSGPHAWMLFDADGVILWSRAPHLASDHAPARPGDLASELRVGTHAIALALLHHRAMAVVGAEHHRVPWREDTSLAAPICDQEGALIGGVALHAPQTCCAPAHLLLISHMAFAIERELTTLTTHTSATADIATLRAVATAERLSRLRVDRLQQITATFAASVDLRMVAEAGLRAALDATQAAAAALFVCDEASHGLRLLESIGLSAGDRQRWAFIPASARVGTNDALQRGAPIYLESQERWAARYPGIVDLDVQTGARALLPLIVDGRRLGVLSICFAAWRPVDNTERAFLQALADQCAQAIERARLYHAAERARAESEAAYERVVFLSMATETLASTLDHDRALEKIAELAVPQIADWCAVEILEGDVCAQLTVAHKDPAMVAHARALRERYPPRPDTPGGIYEVVRTRTSRLYPEIPDAVLARSAVDEEHLRLSRALGLRSAMIVPMIARGRALGTITFVLAESERRFDDKDLAMAEELGRRAAIALDNARLFEDAHRRARQQQAVAEFGRQAFEAALGELWSGAVEVVCQVLDADGATIVEHELGGLRLRAARGIAETAIGDLFPDLHVSLGGHAIACGGLIVVEDVAHETRFDPRLLREHGAVSAMSVPIPGRARPYGALSTYSRSPRAFGAAEANFLASMANVLGAALQQGAYRAELEEGARQKDQFMAMLAHELRNPLAAIQSAVTLLGFISDDLKVPAARAVEIIGRQVKHMVHLVNDLLDVSRIIRGKIELRAERFDLEALIDEVGDDLAQIAQDKGLSLEVERVDDDLDPLLVHGDRVRLIQAVSNLVHNAIKFTPRGGCVALEVAGTHDLVHICVTDTGMGIEADALSSIFEPFSQADRSLDRAAGGLGLGLSVVHGLVSLHGGQIKAHSDGPGEGARFEILLPRARATDDA